jgi:hypothetical protein
MKYVKQKKIVPNPTQKTDGHDKEETMHQTCNKEALFNLYKPRHALKPLLLVQGGAVSRELC